MVKYRSLLRVAPFLLIVAVGIIAYGNTLQNGFVYDDLLAVKDNTFITSLSNLRHLFGNDYYLASGETSWRPVATISFFIDYHIWKDNSFGYHLTNLMLHISNAVLLYILLLRMVPIFGNGGRGSGKNGAPRAAYLSIPLLTSLFFVCHPVQSEAVNSPGFRHEVLFTLFYLLSFISYLKARAASAVREKRVFYGLAALSYLLGMLSKEMAMLLPFVILAMEGIISIGDRRENIFSRERLAAFAAYALSLAVYIWVRFFRLVYPTEELRTIFYEDAFFGAGIYPWFLTTSRIFASYLKIFLWPLDLSPEHLITVSRSITDSGVILSIAALALVAICIIRWFKRAPLVSFAFFWIFIPLVAVSNIVPLSHKMAERYLYICTAGFSLLLAASLEWAFFRFSGRSRALAKALFITAVITVLGLYSAKAMGQNRIWMNDEVFWGSILARPGPHSGRAYNNLGVYALSKGDIRKAIGLFNRALKEDPEYVHSYNNLGLAYQKMGDNEKAVKNYNEILKYKDRLPKMALKELYTNLGILFLSVKDYDRAAEYLEKAIEINPYMARSYINLGTVYTFKEMPDKAMKYYKKGLELNPHMAEALCNLGGLYSDKGDGKNAVECYEKALEINPHLGQARCDLADIYANSGLMHKAAVAYKEALRLNPGMGRPYYGLALISLKAGRREEAIDHLEQAVHVRPDYGAAYEKLSEIYEEAGEEEKAEEWRRRYEILKTRVFKSGPLQIPPHILEKLSE